MEWQQRDISLLISVWLALTGSSGVGHPPGSMHVLDRGTLVVLAALVACDRPAADDQAPPQQAALVPSKASPEAASPVKEESEKPASGDAEADSKAAGEDKTAKPTEDGAEEPSSMSLAAKVEQFAVVEVTADVSGLPESERKALDEIIGAAKLMDPIFDRQVWRENPDLAKTLATATDEASKARYAYFRIMRGPWDRQAHHEAFATELKRPPGGGFYPSDLTEEAFNSYVEAHADQADALRGLFTVVERDGDNLKATPYAEVYGEWLKPAAEHLRAAAKLTTNASLKAFLNARADAFLSDDYYASDKAWMDLDSQVEVTIGPYETYEDQLAGLKASYEAFVTVSDPEASAALDKYKGYLPQMEANLPVADEVKTERGGASPIRVVDLVYASGDARKSVQTIAFNLPNDERVRKEKGAKKVLLRNVIETKFDKIMMPIGKAVLAPEHHENLSSEAFFLQTLFHELSHSLGPAFSRGAKEGEQVEIRVALGAHYSPLEECKADVLGAYNLLFMIEKGELAAEMREKILTSYFGGLFRSVRFGVAEAHGQGAAIQINRYLEDGAASFDDTNHQIKVDLTKLEASLASLASDLIMLQHNGDRAAAGAFLDKYGVMSPTMETVLGTLGDVPVDLRPYYPLAGESAPY